MYDLNGDHDEPPEEGAFAGCWKTHEDYQGAQRVGTQAVRITMTFGLYGGVHGIGRLKQPAEAVKRRSESFPPGEFRTATERVRADRLAL